MDYFDILLAKKLEGGGGGDVTIEQLDVTENGTYSEPGKAYRPVIVNLPLDEKTITANGTYNASDDNLQGFNKVVVNVAGYKLKAMTPGAIASFNDGQALPLTKLLIDIDPVQTGSGDPSPNNERPIYGWNAANININNINIWDEETESGAWSVNGAVVDNTKIRCKNYISVKPGETYYIKTESGILTFLAYDKNKNVVRNAFSGYDTIQRENASLTIPGNIYYLRFYKTGTSYNNDISINYPATDTSYNAHNPNAKIINIAFTDSVSPLTVYGGTLDIVNGEIVLTDLYGKKNGSEWDSLYVSSQTDDVVVYSITLQDASATDNFIISNRFSTNITSGNPGRMVKTGKTLYFVIAKSELTTYDSAGGVEWLANNSTDFIYKLETPQTYHLIPTPINALSGVNNIFADIGDILEVEYFAAL